MKKVLIVVSVGLMTMASSAFAVDCDQVRRRGLNNIEDIFTWSRVAVQSSLEEKHDQAKVAKQIMNESLDHAAKYASIYNAFCKD